MIECEYLGKIKHIHIKDIVNTYWTKILPGSYAKKLGIYYPDLSLKKRDFKGELCGHRNAGEENIIIKFCRGNIISKLQWSNFKTPLSCDMLATTREANNEVSDSIDSSWQGSTMNPHSYPWVIIESP